MRGLVIVGLAYIGFTWFVPIPRQPHWLTDAQMLPIIQDTDEVLLTLIPARDHPGFAVSPREGSRDAVGDLIRRGQVAEDETMAPTPPEEQSVQHKSKPKNAMARVTARR